MTNTIRMCSRSPEPQRRSISLDIPFYNPIAGVRVGLVDGKYVVNPTYEQLRELGSQPDRRRQRRGDLQVVEAGREGGQREASWSRP
jgi:hypothetical protein